MIILASAITVCVSVFPFDSLVTISEGVTDPAVGTKFVQSNK